MVSIALVGVMLVGALTVASASAKDRVAQKNAARGQALARALLAEVVQHAYQQPGVTTSVLGPEAGETRATFNDVDDYNGYTESPPADLTGTPIPDFTGWTRSVLVEWATASPGAPTFATSPVETGLKRITVTVADPNGKTSIAVALRSRGGLYDKPQNASANYTSYVGMTLQIGSDATTSAAGGANALNQVP